jgi:hypothetical protein
MMWKPPPTPAPPKGGVEYRLYFLDGLGHIQGVDEFEAKDDDEAIKISQERWREGRRIELWQGGRLVLHQA